MKKLPTRTIVCLPVILLMLTACVASPPKRLDVRFGNALGMAKAQQTVNPDASLNTAPVRGVDGQAGDAMIDNYRDSFINRPAPARGALDVGTSGGSKVGTSQ
ncbi:MAG: tRNA dimethylallyltransferase [Candidatus Nitrotoga sp.]|nr:tRNA dimethylallyltransferase [Candidatus Nitrotoga sp.]